MVLVRVILRRVVWGLLLSRREGVNFLVRVILRELIWSLYYIGFFGVSLGMIVVRGPVLHRSGFGPA